MWNSILMALWMVCTTNQIWTHYEDWDWESSTGFQQEVKSEEDLEIEEVEDFEEEAEENPMGPEANESPKL